MENQAIEMQLDQFYEDTAVDIVPTEQNEAEHIRRHPRPT